MKIRDCIIVGAGPAGLTAAMYMARYRRDVLVLHDGRARALQIPKTRNVPGFPEGVNGVELIERMTVHATEYGAEMAKAAIVSADNSDGVFHLRSETASWQARSLILATGICLNQIDMPEDEHRAAIDAGILRYCPVCDGYEHIDQKIAVVGCDTHGAAEALFLRRFSADITLIPNHFAELVPSELAAMRDAGIQVIDRRWERLQGHDDRMEVYLAGDSVPLSFDVVYPALGCQPRNEIARSFGLPLAATGEVPIDSPQATPVEGLFAAGDVVESLDQISVAMGHGAIAATKAHNWLRARDGHTL